MLRSIGAVVAGYAAMVVVVMAGSLAWSALRRPDGAAPPASYLAFNLTLSLFAAVLAGWVTAGIAASAPISHLLALGALIIAMAIVTSRQPGAERQPRWYQRVIPVVGLAGLALSTLLR